MKMFCISDNQDLTAGLMLSGIKGITLYEKQEILNKIEEVSNTDEIGILAVSENIYNTYQDEIEKIQENKKLPLIIKIPLGGKI